MPSTAGPAPDASAMDASLEKVRKERAALRSRVFATGATGFLVGLRSLAGGGRPGRVGRATSRGPVTEGRWARRCRSRLWLYRGSA